MPNMGVKKSDVVKARASYGRAPQAAATPQFDPLFEDNAAVDPRRDNNRKAHGVRVRSLATAGKKTSPRLCRSPE